jgi:uncharacterized protein (DUF885 family)
VTETLTRSPVDELADRFWAAFLERQPIYATVIGDHRYDDRLDDPSAAGREREAAALRDVQTTAASIDRDALDAEDRITLGMLEVVARIGLEQQAQRFHEFEALDHMNGPQGLTGTLARIHQVDGAETLEPLLARLAAYPEWVASHVTNLREGVQTGRTAARIAIERSIEQTERLIETPLDEMPLLVANAGLEEGLRGRLREAVEAHEKSAQRSYLGLLREYLPHARKGEGLGSIPGGDAAYRAAIIAWTTIEAEAQELHDYGLEQIAAIDAERLAIARKLGHADVAALLAAVEADPLDKASEPGELVELARRQIEKANGAAPDWFGRLPKAAIEVRAVEPYMEREAPAAFYYPPAEDGSRPGIYFINTYQPEERPLHHLASITYHEATPGHHFQIAIETELDGLHPFRRMGSRLAGASYVEGWGLYTERLADEMGLYEDERERLGMLGMQALRAARLVLDTGIHALGWGRERSIAYLEGLGITRLVAQNEVDRYIVWPGQALSYMVGQREILGLRRDLEGRDGGSFDLKAFHDAVLRHGSLPLATLRAELPGWVSARES